MTVEEAVTNKCHICDMSADLALQKDFYDIYRCSACDFLFLNPYPSDSDITAYYSKNYRGADVNYYPKARSRQRRAFLKAFRFWKYLFNKRALDIGSGGGFMTNAFRRLGAEAHGLDISDNSTVYARNLFPECTFHCESFNTMAESDLVFDFISTTELLEHIPGTRNFMKMVDSVSKPGTIVYLSTPDSGHKEVPEDISLWYEICPPEHLQWFNQSNMTKLFRNYGFKLVKAFTKKSCALSMLFKRVG